MILKGKVAIVTAASRGIGAGVANVLAREGADLVVAARDVKRLEETAKRLSAQYGVSVVPVQADLTRREDVKRIAEQAVRNFGKIDILAYNTGPPKPGAFLELTEEDWEYGVRLLLLSAVWITRDVLPYMIERRWGRLIYITSSTLKQPIPTLTLSNVIRISLAGLVKTLAYQLGRYNILVNGIMQGYIDTDRVREVAAARAAAEGKTVEEVIAEMGKEVPLGRLGKPEEIGELVAFLASEKANYITGSLILIDGGRTLCI
ncbi:Dehydrogenases with different specificities (related to short-chain alcohol dehydrogenases) [Pyrobaculum oguniense TE7]|uniref:Dehydrogenases with different specificities (Related to short-chain alcohol dehydrogenases) n=1 Tax=Pyrobaculum oguniense (strain DSM 13380 / JCM 10595 / TE7) TaxID=698757 RepID=H6QDC5_PYROT|nr:Dehydrogenases with different specificities (related to short-chain alcohol dehydrogenases) [Pyrobaculum oguniense TE7]